MSLSRLVVIATDCSNPPFQLSSFSTSSSSVKACAGVRRRCRQRILICANILVECCCAIMLVEGCCAIMLVEGCLYTDWIMLDLARTPEGDHWIDVSRHWLHLTCAHKTTGKLNELLSCTKTEVFEKLWWNVVIACCSSWFYTSKNLVQVLHSERCWMEVRVKWLFIFAPFISPLSFYEFLHRRLSHT